MAYAQDHYKVVAELLNSGANINFKTGDFAINDFLRACGWGTISFVKRVLKCNGDVKSTDLYGKTPFIFAVDFKSDSNCLELIDLLVKNGASINNQDASGLTALHYACIRGKLDVVEKLLSLNANPYCLNRINYSPLTYSLCYISFMQYIDTETYSNRLEIVKLLINSIDELSKIKQCIIGSDKTPNLVALFNFIFYGLSQGLESIEQIGWSFYNEILVKAANKETLQSIDDQLFTIAQYLIMYNQNIFYFNYFVQRVQLAKLNDLLLFYLVTFFNGKKDSLRINLLIYYSLLSNDGDALKFVVSNNVDVDSSTENFIDLNRIESSLNIDDDFNGIEQHITDNENSYTDISSRLTAIIKAKAKKPFSLKCLCRRSFRLNFKHLLFYFTNNMNIPKNLKRYLLYEELNDYVNSKDFSVKSILEIISKL